MTFYSSLPCTPAVLPEAETAETELNAKQRKSTQRLRELGDSASWTLSSCKKGFGINELRDNDPDTYWQSDGPQPHTINIHFQKKVCVSLVSLFLDYTNDESYTPHKISLRAGTSFSELVEVTVHTQFHPTQWVDIKVTDEDGSPLRTHIVQIAVICNHQNGKDTHIRQAQIYGPELYPSFWPNEPPYLAPELNTGLLVR